MGHVELHTYTHCLSRLSCSVSFIFVWLDILNFVHIFCDIYLSFDWSNCHAIQRNFVWTIALSNSVNDHNHIISWYICDGKCDSANLKFKQIVKFQRTKCACNGFFRTQLVLDQKKRSGPQCKNLVAIQNVNTHKKLITSNTKWQLLC